MDSLIIREAVHSDLPAIHQLIAALALFEREPEEHTLSLERFALDFKKGYDCLVAVTADDEAVGMALYYWGYSSWKGKMLYLDDLVVDEQYRSKGIGSKLFNEVIAIAERNNAGQVRWQVLDWNEPAIKMYKKANADFYDNWLTCKLEKQAIAGYRPI